MKSPFKFKLVADHISSDTVTTLEQLLLDAKAGKIIGVAFAAMYKERAFIVDTTGEARRSPTFTRGMLAALDDTLAKSIGAS